METIPEEVIERDSIIEKNETFLRKDIYRFMNYVFNNQIKRSRKGNFIPPDHARKLMKILSFDEEKELITVYGHGYWSDFISKLVRAMKLVNFDLEGEYRDYNIFNKYWENNYIVPNREEWNNYLNLTGLEKEEAIMESLLNNTANEFSYKATLLSNNRFDRYTLNRSNFDLPVIRKKLLGILYKLEPEVWYSIADMIKYLKENQFNLILDHKKEGNILFNYRNLSNLKKEIDYKVITFIRKSIEGKEFTEEELLLKLKNGKIKSGDIEKIIAYSRDSKNGVKVNLYSSFYEINNGTRREIFSGESDSFERVEGRYFAFFLEEIPFIMNFVNLAYEKTEYDMTPEPYGGIKAFMMTEKFFDFYGKNPSYNHVKITVKADHEAVVEYNGYCEKEVNILNKFGTAIKDDRAIIYRLEKQKISDRVASGEDIKEIIKELAELSSLPLPQNIITEMEEWGAHGEKITLYRNFSLVEASEFSEEVEKTLGRKIEEKIDRGLFIVKPKGDFFSLLEKNEFLPEKYNHKEKLFDYKNFSHSIFKRDPSKEKQKCDVKFHHLAGFISSNKEILGKVGEELEKKDIEVIIHSEENLLLVPLVYMETLKNITCRLIEKSGMIVEEE